MKMRNRFNQLYRIGFEVTKAMLWAICIVLIMKSALVEANQIVSGSMRPTLKDGDFVLVNKLEYGIHIPFLAEMFYIWSEPKRGDVVTFTPPMTDENGKARLFIKRIIALPGDVVMIRDSILFINHKPVNSVKINAGTFIETIGEKVFSVTKKDDHANFGPVTVPVGYVFVMGDNRDNSHDSRNWGPLPISRIEGRAAMIYFTKKTLLEGDLDIRRIGSLL